MRTEQAKRFIRFKQKGCIFDSTISRSLAGYHLQPLRQYLKTMANKTSHNGKCCVDVYGKKLKLACVDGFMFGKFYGRVFQLFGEKRLCKTHNEL